MTEDPSTPWQELDSLWHTLFALPEAERQRRLEELKAEDSALHGEVAALFASIDPAEMFFQRFAGVVNAGRDAAVSATAFEALRTSVAERYSLEREIGQGGMATVYLARDLRHDREVALKVLKPEIAAALGTQRFLREIEIAARLRHPHIVPVYDSGEAGAFPYYVMPYESGRSLRELLRREGPLPIDDAVRIVRDVLDALAYAHDQGIVHRDIKPENVLLSARHATVADFGVAKAVAEASKDPMVTASGLAVGTPRYMAPEQAAGELTVDHRADLYAVGVMAYEMLAGSPPFTGETAHATLTAHLREPPVPLANLRPAVPAALAELVMRCLEKRPADRWQRADDLLERIDSSGTPTPVTPVEAPLSVTRRRLAGRRGMAIGATVAAIAALSWSIAQESSRVVGEPAPSIAVLPLVNQGDPDDGALADGMTTELNSKLAVAGLRPVASTSVFAFRDRHSDVRTIADSLQVAYLLEGEWQRVGADLRVRVALVDARDRSTLWSETYRRNFDDVFVIQDDIARSVAREVGLQLGDGAEATRSADVGTGNAAAYEFYVRGRDERVFRSDSAARQAIVDLRQAVALDSMFAGAWAGLANMYLRVAPPEAPDMPFNERLPVAERFALHALALDSLVPEVHEVLGLVRLRQYRFEETRSRLERSIQLDPSRYRSWEYMVYLETWLGRYPQALGAAQRALAIAPLSPSVYAEVAYGWYLNGRCDEARERLALVANVHPPVGRAALIAARCYALEQRWDEAIAEATAGPPGPPGMRTLGYLMARAGRRDEAQRELTALLERSQPTGGEAVDVALVYAGLGDLDQAFAWLERARLDFSLRWNIREPVFGDLHGDLRFDALLQRVGVQNR